MTIENWVVLGTLSQPLEHCSRLSCVQTVEALKARINELESKQTCTWKAHDDVHMPGTYETGCGQLWSFAEGGINENNTVFCHSCGGRIEVKHDTV